MSKELTTSERNKLRKFKVYTEQDFKALRGAENRQERLLAAVLDDREAMLSDTDFRYLQLLRRAFNVMTNNLSELIARRKVEKLLEIPSRSRVRQIMSDVKLIFMDNEERNEAWERQVFEMKVSKLIERLERKDPESKSIADLYKLLAKIKGIDRHKDESIPWAEWELPLPEYTSDPNDIEGNPTINTSYEEV